MSELSETSGVTETVASLRSCLPTVSTIVPFIDPEILLFMFSGLFFCERAENPASKRKIKIMRL
jgi:hypothetical protein